MFLTRGYGELEFEDIEDDQRADVVLSYNLVDSGFFGYGL